ncbi:hypothetical protein H9I48_03150 [Wolbachia pipientis]|uniref:transposase n=1 Tax=Wolbachia pipientis TaxID=955 RepID=UPI001650E4C3|nr:hypothetical protein [Wolbachia pipientis]
MLVKKSQGHIAVDTQVLPHAIYVTTAGTTDRSSAVRMVNNAKENLSGVKDILVDAGYTGENFATQIKATIGATVEVIKRSEFEQALTKYTKNVYNQRST